MKKVLALFFSVVLLVSLCATGLAAGTEIKVNAPSSMPKSGESFEVTVEISANPGFNVLDLFLSYNTAQFTCKSVETGTVLGNALAATNENNQGRAVVSSASVKKVTGDGVLAVLVFTADQDVTDYSFSLRGTAISDENGNEIQTSFVTPAGKENTPPVKPNEGQSSGQTAPPAPQTQFTDTAGHWGASFIAEATQRGLFKGYSDGSFKPDVSVTRAQFVTVLWRMAGSPASGASTPFTDISGQIQEFKTAIAWAYSKGYINGNSATTFSPDSSLTREAAMKILFGYAGGVGGMEMMFTGIYDDTFPDSGKISSWGKSGMYWGIYHEIISGTNAGTLDPQGEATRAQLAKILVNYLNKSEGGKI